MSVLATLFGDTTWAQSIGLSASESIVLPDDRSKSVGFQCKVEISASRRPGYDTVQMTFDLPVASPARRLIVARLNPLDREMAPQRNAILVELPLTIQQGSTHVEFTRYVPKWQHGNSYTIRLLEGGRSLEAYVGELGWNLPNPRVVADQMTGDEIFRQWLVIEPASNPAFGTSDADSIRTWLGLVSHLGNPSAYYPMIQNRGTSASSVGVSIISANGLPTDWRTFQDHDSIVLDTATLARLKSDQPQQFIALNRWILLGGTMVVRGIKPDSDLATVLGRPNSSWNADLSRRQMELAVEGHRLNLEDLRMSLGPVTNRSFTSGKERLEYEKLINDALSQHDSVEGQKLLAEIATTDKAIQYQSVGAGHVVGFCEDYPETLAHWSIADQLLSTWNSPALRRGVDPLFGDSRFRRWLIPGVAQPPVYTFIGLLTGFVILVGPVAYRQTTKRGRGYLMFAIAPFLALLTTASMFAYGIVSDGFGTVARIRQITWIDGASGDAVTRTRSTYFAGIRPADGLRFDAEAEVLWYPDASDMSWLDIMEQNTPALGTVTIDERDQRFTSSFLPSRQQRQFVVHQAIPDAGSLTAKRIVSDTPPGANGPSVTLAVQNDLAIDLKQIVIRDEEGEFWHAESVPANSRITIDEPIKAKDRSKMLGDLFNVQRLLEENSAAQRYGRNTKNFDLILQLNVMFMGGDREVTDGAMERWLRDSLQLGGSLSPGTYIGLAAIDPRFVAVEGTELVESVHFVIGTMP